MSAVTHFNRRGLIETAMAALQSERVSIMAERSAPATAEAIHKLGGANAVALVAFAESRVISNMLRLARAELAMAEEGLRVGDGAFVTRALDNAEAWFDAALAACTTEEPAFDEPAESVH
jgi:hypothetical protein